ncbi:hypothetical protein [Enterococcus pallens]|uniref:Glycosyltransferase RgtA/B/C/D-like domain-containing protein n=1 Tax=Enterococcus pallens ATCC BAA-351 TaxID=1158607 RepID=R2SG48_9ENTE|nr:hypothetical protein [Enterococcus pallens]EOH91856.1 hypothetical protein UAU_03158 [Enterococcus pallens ATCC BAA-351]EOU25284.1 hypothetical protein I588_01272 [Enterococcus pallens ATCC BAA-351]OJG79914.1 hypothetical protein RV10_GL004984 [Enterococcus pallens]
MKKNSVKIFYLVLITATILRIILAYLIPVKVYMQAEYDDALSINQALFILAGKWLGPYDIETLSKGFSYTFFLLANHFSRIPYPIFLVLFNIIAGIGIIIAFKPLIKNKFILGFSYLFLIYSPITLSSDFSLRIYRNSLVFGTVLLLLAGIIGMYLRKRDSLKKQLPWLLLQIIILPFFWYLREDSIWIAPLYGTVILLLLFDRIQYLKEANKPKFVGVLKQIILLTMPFLSLLLVTLGISQVNFQHYQIFTVNDRTKTSFAEITKHLIQIDNSEWDSSEIVNDEAVWVSKNTFEKAMEASPTLAEYRDEIHWMQEESFWPDTWPLKSDEVPGDMTIWGLRDAFKRGGLYKSGAENERVFKKISQELQTAFDEGKFEKKKTIFISKQSNGKHIADIPKVLIYTATGIRETTMYTSYNTSYGGSIFIPGSPAIDILNLLNVQPLAMASVQTSFEYERTKSYVLAGNIIIKAYKIVSPMLAVISLIVYLISIKAFVKTKNKNERKNLYTFLLIITGLGLTYLLYLFGVSWFATWAPGGKGIFMSFYTGAGVPLMQLIEILCITLLIQSWQKRKEANK